MATSTNARNVQEMMYQNTEAKTLKRLEPMTEKGVKTLTALKQIQKLPVLGGRKISAEQTPTAKFPTPYEWEHWFVSHASDAGNQNLSLIMKTMTSLWMSCGFANRATSNGTKNF